MHGSAAHLVLRGGGQPGPALADTPRDQHGCSSPHRCLLLLLPLLPCEIPALRDFHHTLPIAVQHRGFVSFQQRNKAFYVFYKTMQDIHKFLAASGSDWELTSITSDRTSPGWLRQ